MRVRAPDLTGQRVVVTGAHGFIGRRIVPLIAEAGGVAISCDISDSVLSDGWAESIDADAVIHLAAHKHAPMGEEYPAEVADLNVRGTANAVAAVPRVVLASTCKAAAPITAYGASKLIAERIVLNAGGVVVRLVNVLGSSGSVAQIWDQLPPDEPLPVTDCKRMFITPTQAAQTLVGALALPTGRYAPASVTLREMTDVASELHPGRAQTPIPLRVGDRPVERLTNDYETLVEAGSPPGFVRIVDCWGV